MSSEETESPATIKEPLKAHITHPTSCQEQCKGSGEKGEGQHELKGSGDILTKEGNHVIKPKKGDNS